MATPDFIHLEGWDKYGAPKTNLTDARNTPLWTDEWQFTITGSGIYLDNPTNGVVPGHASLQLRSANAGGSSSRIQKSLPNNYARVVGGFTALMVDSFSQCGMLFMDAGTTQLTLLLNNSTGHIEVRRGDWGTLIATSTDTYAVNTPHCIEYDITFHASAGIVKVWLDGTLTSINLTGQNTISSGNNYINRYGPGTISASGQHNCRYDHMYHWFYLASGGTETPCLDNPVIETAQGSGDSATTWTVGAHSFPTPYFYYGINGFTLTLAANVYLRRVQADQSGSISNVTIGYVNTTSPTANYKAVIYSDNAGVPNTLLATGTQVTGAVSGSNLVLPVALAGVTAGTYYWVGFISDTNINYACNDEAGTSYSKANTYTSGPPSPAGTGFTTNSNNINMSVTMTGVTARYPQIDNWRPLLDQSYNMSGTIGQRDLYSFPPLSSTPAAIHGVSVKANVGRSDSGTRQVKLPVKSGPTLSYGYNLGITPAIAWSCEGNSWFVDPNTSAAWTAANLNAALFGVEVTA